jgi:glycosyltransferase involved in cell wall biosynthesis
LNPQPDKKVPLVSVYLPTHNRCALLSRAVDSVLAQSLTNFEILIIDDGSSDGTRTYLQDLRLRDNRVTILRNRKPKGACYGRNLAIENSKGYFITGLDDDDYFTPDRLQAFVEHWDDSAVATYSDTYLIVRGTQKTVLRPHEIQYSSLLRRNGAGNQVFLKTETLRKSMFNTDLPIWQDIGCWLELTKNGGVMKNIGQATMFVDATHLGSRITSGKSDKVKTSISCLVSKLDLNDQEHELLKLQAIENLQKSIPISKLVTYLSNWQFSLFFSAISISLVSVAKTLAKRIIWGRKFSST